jgi:drug/metabolite transporter (DMT)-like permease
MILIHENHTALMYSILTGFCYALTYSITKNTLEQIPESTNLTAINKSIYILLLANITAVIILSIYFFLFIYNKAPKSIIFKKRYFKLAFFIGLTSAIGTYLLYRSIDKQQISITVPIIGGSLGLFVILFAKFIFKEKISILLVLGILFIGLGIYITNKEIKLS